MLSSSTRLKNCEAEAADAERAVKTAQQPQPKKKKTKAKAKAKTPAPDPRRAQLLDAAVGVFLRYGHKKTSMDDVARAAGLSRQGLYGHWTSKDALFKDAVTHVVEQSVGAALACLDEANVVADAAAEDADHRADPRADGLAGAIVGAFCALHGVHFTRPIATEHMTELLAAAAAVGVDVVAAERPFRLALAKLLQARRGLKPKEAGRVADVLEVASVGLKHLAPSLEAFRARMATVVDVVVGAAV